MTRPLYSLSIWRRRWDSNPRYGYPYNGFRDRSVSNGNWRYGQFSVVAGPRNQRYLHPRSPGAGVLICEVKEGSKLPIELHPKPSVFRYKPDLFDELTDAFGGLEAGLLAIQGFGEIVDLLAVEFGKVRMQSRHGRGRCFKPIEEFRATWPPGPSSRP